jgi:alkyl hydroperoxide reductase subunit AhpC
MSELHIQGSSGATRALEDATPCPGKWLVLFAWPMDFTFVCPTEMGEGVPLRATFIVDPDGIA